MANSPDGTASSFAVFVAKRGGSPGAQIAIRLDAPSAGVMYRRAYTSSWGSWQRVLDSSQDTDWVTSGTGITAASGWTLNSAKYRILNGVAHLSVQTTKAGSASPATNSAGSYANTNLVNLPGNLTPSGSNGNYANVGANASFLAGGYASASGVIILTVAVPSYAVPVGATVDLMGSHVL